MPNKPDMINHPHHYNHGEFETIEVIEDWGLGYHDGNAVKYLSRWRHKHEEIGGKLADLEKARWYVDRQINKLKVEVTDAKD